VIELFLNAIPNVLAAMFVGSAAGGIVQVCEDEIPKLATFKERGIDILIDNNVEEKIRNAFWSAYDSTYAGPKLPSSCELALAAVGSSKLEVENVLNGAGKPNIQEDTPIASRNPFEQRHE